MNSKQEHRNFFVRSSRAQGVQLRFILSLMSSECRRHFTNHIGPPFFFPVPGRIPDHRYSSHVVLV